MLKPEECKPGALVEAIHAEAPLTAAHAKYLPSVGSLWTISHHEVHPCVIHGERHYITLNEMPIVAGFWALLWTLDRFRLVPDKRLEVFRAMLVNPKVDA